MAKKPTIEFVETVTILHNNQRSNMTGVTPRNSDTELMVQILQLCRNAKLNERQLNIIRSINWESVFRARRKLQEKGYFVADPEVRKKRHQKEIEIQQVAVGVSPEELQRRLSEN